MRCPLVKSNALILITVFAVLLSGPQAWAEIRHTQVETYDFATQKQTRYDVDISLQDKGALQFASTPVASSERQQKGEFRLCLNRDMTAGYLRLLAREPEQPGVAAPAPLLNFARETDLHLALIALPDNRRLVFFTDTLMLWVADGGTVLSSSPDCHS